MLLMEIYNWNCYIMGLIQEGNLEAATNEILKETEGLTDRNNICDWIALVNKALDFVEEDEEHTFDLEEVTIRNFLDDVCAALLDENLTGSLSLKTKDADECMHKHEFDTIDDFIRATNSEESNMALEDNVISLVINDEKIIDEDTPYAGVQIEDLCELLEHVYSA